MPRILLSSRDFNMPELQDIAGIVARIFNRGPEVLDGLGLRI